MRRVRAELALSMQTPGACGRRAQFQLSIFSYHNFRNSATGNVRNTVKSHLFVMLAKAGIEYSVSPP
jgi:hypothetical protein